MLFSLHPWHRLIHRFGSSTIGNTYRITTGGSLEAPLLLGFSDVDMTVYA